MSRRGVPEPAFHGEDEAFVGSNAMTRARYDAMLEQQLGANILSELQAKCNKLAQENRLLVLQVTALSIVLDTWRFWRWLTSLFKRKVPR